MPRARACRTLPQLSLLLPGFLAALSGCVTADGTLKPDGSGTLELVYQVPPNSSETLEKRRLTSPQVTLESLKLRDDGMAAAKLSFDDPAKLSTLDLLRHVRITRQREGEDERLTITMKNPIAKELKDKEKPGPEIRLTLPGKVLEANRNATVDGNHVAWRFTMTEFFKESAIDLTARYRVPVAGEPTPAGQPAKDPSSGH